MKKTLLIFFLIFVMFFDCQATFIPEAITIEEESITREEIEEETVPELDIIEIKKHYKTITKKAATQVETEFIEITEQTSACQEIFIEEVKQATIVEPPEITPIETQIETQTEPVVNFTVSAYSIYGQVLREDIQGYLCEKMTAAGIGWFVPYALAIAYQESSFNVYAENANGLDKGLFQYRLPYWGESTAEAGRAGADIFDPYAQIDVLTMQMARRAAAGCDVYTMISRHNMSDYGPYNQVYVNQVIQHLGSLNKVK